MKKLIISVMLLLSGMAMHAQEKTDTSRFTWGIDLGSSIDMSGEEMTNLNFSAQFGLKNNYFRLLGVGSEINIMTGNSSRSIPVYAIMRTSFTPQPRKIFADIRAGVSFNEIYDIKSQTGLYFSPAIGLSLANGSKFKSHLSLGYTLITRSNFNDGETLHTFKDLHFATIRLGISF